MRIFFDYPLATDENIKAVKEAINTGIDAEELFEMFDDVMLWDCLVVISGQQDIQWNVFHWQDGNEQYRIEDWQIDGIEVFIKDMREK